MHATRLARAVIAVLTALALSLPATARPPERLAADPASAATDLAVPLVSSTLAAADTLYLLGGPDRQDGDFQDDASPALPSADGWRPYQEAEPPLWHVDTFNAAALDPGTPGNHAMWCGKAYRPCPGDVGDENPGYGANLDESLSWDAAVPDPQDTTVVTVTAVLNYDMEPGYDYLTLERLEPDGFTAVATWNGTNRTGGVFAPEVVDVAFAVPPEAYLGAGADEIHLRWRFTADGAFNDEDCLFPTDGAAQVDDIAVSFDQGTGPVPVTFDDFESGNGNWTPHPTYDCNDGDLWSGLDAPGLCESLNLTHQLAFLSDGTGCSPVPVYGGPGADYAPGGVVVDCANVSWHRAEWVAPTMVLPDMTDWETVIIEADVFLHNVEPWGPWGVMRARVSETAGRTWLPWGWERAWERYFGSTRPLRIRVSQVLHGMDERVPAANRFQLLLGASRDYYACSGGAPGPWWDNVAVKVVKHAGPRLATSVRPTTELLATDAFPSSGGLDLVDLGSNDVGVGPYSQAAVAVHAAFPRHGSVPAGPPELHWVLKPNPLFDPYRTAMPANPVLGTDDGPVDEITEPDGYGTTRYVFALPDQDFMFPGDELHYYITLQDDVDGDIGTAILPADTTGFGRFDEAATGLDGPYPEAFHVRALPTLRAAHPDSQPAILVWDDSRSRAFSTSIMRSLAALGYRPGRDYDVFHSGSADNRSLLTFTTAVQLAGYSTLIYGSGGQGTTFGWDEHHPLAQWLALGDRNLLVTGDNVLEGTDSSTTLAFLETVLGAELADGWVQPLIDDQALPRVVPTGAVPGFATALVASSCPFADFDAVTVAGTGQVLLEFTGPDGAPAGYPYAAAVHNQDATDGTRSVFLPVDFAKLNTPADHAGGLAARTVFLDEVLTLFGHAGTAAPSDAAPPAVFTTDAAPNPFNPRTRVSWDMPRAGRLTVTLYDVKGRRVRTLVDRGVPAGAGRVDWDGTDDLGRAVASGVYLRVSEALGDRQVAKMTLVR